MGLFGFAALWLGYSTAYYGYNRITGGNNTFVQLVWPGRYIPVARDDGSGGGSSGASSLVSGTTQPTLAGTGAQKGVSSVPGSGILSTVTGGGTLLGTPAPQQPIAGTPIK